MTSGADDHTPRLQGRRQPEAASAFTAEAAPADVDAFKALVSLELDDGQKRRIAEPGLVMPRQREILAAHWHPEHVPLELARTRLGAMFPNMECELVIPTQHNAVMEYGGYCGVEVDCYSRGFNRKVQLLIHFAASRRAQASALESMLAHTFKYRAGQLSDFLNALSAEDRAEWRQEAAARTGANEEVVTFTARVARKLLYLLNACAAATPPDSVKNKLVPNYLDTLRDTFDPLFITRAQRYAAEVKKLVKRHFPLQYFYRTEEIIEEARGLGGCVVIPHPEQFWPILLAGYDVDGIEVWNPQSREYTEFLIQVVMTQNRALRRGRKPVLVFMGDDTHLGEKTRDPRSQNPDKAAREVGYQPAWDELSINKLLVAGGITRARLIEEYKGRLG